MSRTPCALVVDDDADVRELIVRVLTAVGFDVMTANDGRSAVLAAAERPPSFITLDLSLPDTTGTELVRPLRALGDAHLLLVTGHVLSDAERDAVGQEGADGVLTKPFPLRELRSYAELRLRAAQNEMARVAS